MKLNGLPQPDTRSSFGLKHHDQALLVPETRGSPFLQTQGLQCYFQQRPLSQDILTIPFSIPTKYFESILGEV